MSEFLEIVRRELGATEARMLDGGEEGGDGGVLRVGIPGGRLVEVTFAEPPADAQAKRRRLEMLIDSFANVLVPSRPSASRPPPARTLHDELAALAQRAGALDAVVIDAHSPVVWGAGGEGVTEPVETWSEPPPIDNVRRIDQPPGSPKPSPSETAQRAGELGVRGLDALALDPRAVGLVPKAVCDEHVLVPLFQTDTRLVVAMEDPTDVAGIRDVVLATGLDVEPALAGGALIRFALRWNDEAGARTYPEVVAALEAAAPEERRAQAAAARSTWTRHFASRRAVAVVRELPEMATLHRGGHLHHSVSEDDFGYSAHSFAAIYVLILVYGGPFDELRAKRAVAHALPTIERLVLALPPLDPSPNMSGAMAVRRRPRR